MRRLAPIVGVVIAILGCDNPTTKTQIETPLADVQTNDAATELGKSRAQFGNPTSGPDYLVCHNRTGSGRLTDFG